MILRAASADTPALAALFDVFLRAQAGAPAKLLSNRPMDPLHDTDQRLTELEIKASYSDDLLEQLNLIIYRQQQQIDALLNEMHSLRQQMPQAGSGSAPRNLRDELPPHY